MLDFYLWLIYKSIYLPLYLIFNSSSEGSKQWGNLIFKLIFRVNRVLFRKFSPMLLLMWLCNVSLSRGGSMKLQKILFSKGSRQLSEQAAYRIGESLSNCPLDKSLIPKPCKVMNKTLIMILKKSKCVPWI